MNRIKFSSPYSLCPALGMTLVFLMLFGYNLILGTWFLILLVCIVVLWYLKNRQKGEQVKESLISQHDNETCKENGDSLTKEEDLKEAAKHYLYSNILYDDVYVGNPTDKDCIEMFKAGANWKEQQLMAKAVDVTIAIPYQNGYGGYTQLVDSKDGLPFGENLKVLVIKE